MMIDFSIQFKIAFINTGCDNGGKGIAFAVCGGNGRNAFSLLSKMLLNADCKG